MCSAHYNSDGPTVEGIKLLCGSAMTECSSWCKSGNTFDSIIIDLGKNFHVSTVTLNSTEAATTFETTISKAIHPGNWSVVDTGIWVHHNVSDSLFITHWGRDKMDIQATFWNVVYSMKVFEFLLQFHGIRFYRRHFQTCIDSAMVLFSPL